MVVVYQRFPHVKAHAHRQTARSGAAAERGWHPKVTIKRPGNVMCYGEVLLLPTAMFSKIYKVVQVILLVGILVALVLLLRRPQPLTTQQLPASALAANADSFQNKLGQLEQAHATGQSAEARIS